MGKRKGMALSEAEFIGIKNLIKIKCNDKKANELLNFINIMVKTGIRRAEWHILANAYNKYLTRSFEIIIPKQTKKNKMVKRLIKIPILKYFQIYKMENINLNHLKQIECTKKLLKLKKLF